MGDSSDPLAARARYRHPGRGAGFWQWLVARPGWTAFRRALAARLPMPRLRSDVVDIAYLNWWVPVTALPPPPPGHHYRPHRGRVLFTVLNYRHGHFGPAAAGPFRRLFPSPLQSNWRTYVHADGAAADASPTVLFISNVMDSLMHVVGARLASDAMQPQLAARFEHQRTQGVLHTRIDGGRGGAPALRSTLSADAVDPAAPVWWQGAFGNRLEAIGYLACQDEAIAVAADGRMAATRIELPIDPERAQVLTALEIECPLVSALGADVTDAFCFLVPGVRFEVVSERLL